MTKADQIDAVVAATVTAFGGLSTLVNNVGWGGRHDDPTAISDEEFISPPPYDAIFLRFDLIQCC